MSVPISHFAIRIQEPNTEHKYYAKPQTDERGVHSFHVNLKRLEAFVLVLVLHMVGILNQRSWFASLVLFHHKDQNHIEQAEARGEGGLGHRRWQRSIAGDVCTAVGEDEDWQEDGWEKGTPLPIGAKKPKPRQLNCSSRPFSRHIWDEA